MEKTSLTACRGIGPRRLEALRKAGIGSVEELLRLWPRAYLDCRAPVPAASLTQGQTALIRVFAEEGPKLARFGGRSIVTLRCGDESGRILLKWFNQPYRMRQFSAGGSYSFVGRTDLTRGRCMMNPSLYAGGPAIVPVYSAPEGIRQNVLRDTIRQALETAVPEELIPERILREEDLPGIRDALRTVHFPEDYEELERAKRRIAFERALLYLIAVEMRRDERTAAKGIAFTAEGEPERFTERLPYAPTGAQRRAMEEILADMRRPRAMNRLLQGDVGSGKTLVAMLAMEAAAGDGFQSALLAPTELLARQHAESMGRFFPDGVCLLTGSMKKSERSAALHAIGSGEAKYVVGTHALLSGDVGFRRLGLLITDEQHRFGVSQRALAARKGERTGAGAESPDVLVMSATPIPRTMALTLLSDLDVSVLDELPPGRERIATNYIPENKREDMYRWIAEQAESGAQAYVVCPFIADPEAISGRSAEGVHAELTALLPDARIGLLHGKQTRAAQEREMERFRTGETQILVSTTVIEVGVHVENACVMVIESADRFGLAQLHQLRGRVGRGSRKSRCFLLSDDPSDTAKERLEIMCRTCDGFEIAEKDFALRGAGELIGTRQHGQGMWQWIMELGDAGLLGRARTLAHEVMEMPVLENNALAEAARDLYMSGGDPVAMN